MNCPNCGRENPDGFRFCGNCGAPLAAPGEGREERKVVTALFADLVGFTSRAEQLDPEDVRALFGPYHARLREELSDSSRPAVGRKPMRTLSRRSRSSGRCGAMRYVREGEALLAAAS
jgi:zinc-ribbon domain